MADTKISALAAASAAAAANELAINEAGASKKLTVQQIADFLFTRISGSSGAAGPYSTIQKLSADSADQSVLATPGVVMTTTGVGAGTWKFRYFGIYQSAATTTGIKLFVNHTGTSAQFATVMYFPDNSATAATGTGLGISGAAIGRVFSAYAEAVKNTSSFPSVGVVTANADIPVIVEGIIVVSVSGNLELKLGTEVDASAVRLMADSCLELTKIG
jgi:hypothetical protein